MTLLSDFNAFLSNNNLKANISPQVLNEIAQYAKLVNNLDSRSELTEAQADKRKKIVDQYKNAVNRIFSDNPHLYYYASDIFQHVFDKYSQTNLKLAKTKDEVLVLADSKKTIGLKHAIQQDYNIYQMPALEWAHRNNKTIEGISALEWSYRNDVKIEGKSAFLYAVENLGVNQDELLKWFITSDIEIEGISAIKWAVKNDVKIGGESAVKLAVKNNIEISGKPAFLYAVEDLGKNEEKILKYAIKNDVAIGGKPALEWAFMNDKTINDMQAMEFATTNNANVGCVNVMDWIEKNIDRLLAAKDSVNREVVGKHTRKISEQQNTATQSIQTR